MHSTNGRSNKPDPDEAVTEATAGMPAAADIVFAFASTQQEPVQTARAGAAVPHQPRGGLHVDGRVL